MSSSASNDPAQTLPSINDRPNADVVIYDGKCPFCRSQVSRLAAWDGGGRLAFLSAHDPLVAQRYADLSLDQLMTQMYVVDRRERRHGGAAALRYLSRRLPRLWFVAPLLHIPCSLPLWQWVYRQIAVRRYRLAGGPACDDGACQILTPRKNT
jgi:predicted DCC family thiol-disulfide oxidoreductase YuxK